MKTFSTAAIIAAACTMSACATSYTMTPHPTGSQSVRYVQGQATIFADGEHSAVQVTALGPNGKGRLIYSVAAMNRSQGPANFGAENVSLSASGSAVRVFTYAELERMAKNDATMALVLTALAGAGSAYVAASGPTSQSTTYTPFGTYQTSTTNHALQSLAVSAAAATTASQMNSISNNLDDTLMALGSNVLQTTTIDHLATYGGQIVSDRVDIPAEGELSTALTVRFAGETYVVNFGISKQK